MLDDFADEPTVVLPRETAAELMRTDPLRKRTHAHGHAVVPQRPADLTQTRELPAISNEEG